jgi:ADP-ribosylglycohydrolase
MAVALLRALVDAGGTYDEKQAVVSYLDWMNGPGGGCAMAGRNIRALFSNIHTYKGYQNRAKKQFANHPDNQSNGALMRSPPLILLSTMEEAFRLHLMDAVAVDCSVTNPHPICIATNQIYMAVLHHLVHHGSLPVDPTSDRIDLCQVVDKTTDAAHKFKTLRDMLAFSTETREIHGKGKGWCLHGLWCAMQALHRFPATTEGAIDALDWVIRLGGDTDSNAAITGAVMFARVGFKAMLEHPRVRDNMMVLLEAPAVTEGLRYGGPRYHPKNYISLLHRHGWLDQVPSLFLLGEELNTPNKRQKKAAREEGGKVLGQ